MSDDQMLQFMYASFTRFDETVHSSFTNAMNPLISIDPHEQPVFPDRPYGKGFK
jgi:hypothetical protein